MKALILYLWCHRTKCLGFAQVTLGVLATAEGLFSATTLKWIVLTSGVLTAWLGFFNSSRAKKAEE